MRIVATALGLAFMSLIAADAGATDKEAIAIEGAYLLFQDDGYQRAVSFDRGGNMVMASDLEAAYGFTSGVGTWEQTGPDTVKARIVNFNFNGETSDPKGTAIASYNFTFGDMASGKYQTVNGSLSGGEYAFGENPLSTTKEPERTFEIGFKGIRITAQ